MDGESFQHIQFSESLWTTGCMEEMLQQQHVSAEPGAALSGPELHINNLYFLFKNGCRIMITLKMVTLKNKWTLIMCLLASTRWCFYKPKVMNLQSFDLHQPVAFENPFVVSSLAFSSSTTLVIWNLVTIFGHKVCLVSSASLPSMQFAVELTCQPWLLHQHSLLHWMFDSKLDHNLLNKHLDALKIWSQQVGLLSHSGIGGGKSSVPRLGFISDFTVKPNSVLSFFYIWHFKYSNCYHNF